MSDNAIMILATDEVYHFEDECFFCRQPIGFGTRAEASHGEYSGPVCRDCEFSPMEQLQGELRDTAKIMRAQADVFDELATCDIRMMLAV